MALIVPGVCYLRYLDTRHLYSRIPHAKSTLQAMAMVSHLLHLIHVQGHQTHQRSASQMFLAQVVLMPCTGLVPLHLRPCLSLWLVPAVQRTTRKDLPIPEVVRTHRRQRSRGMAMYWIDVHQLMGRRHLLIRRHHRQLAAIRTLSPPVVRLPMDTINQARNRLHLRCLSLCLRKVRLTTTLFLKIHLLWPILVQKVVTGTDRTR